jgi:hypothetical protein
MHTSTKRHGARFLVAEPGRTVVLKEMWWPSAGDPAATPDGQLALQHEWLWSLPSPGYR